MQIIIHKSASKRNAIVSVAAFLMIGVFLALTGIAHAANLDSQRGKLITIHDRGTEKVVLSDGPTIGDAIRNAGITVNADDTVEPSVSQKLIASDYQVNIYRARPVIIVDGNVRQEIVTSYQTPTQIAAAAGITMYPEDQSTIGLSDSTGYGIATQLAIVRATALKFDLYGSTSLVRTQAKTIGDMLKEKGISLSKDDRVSPSVGTPITADMHVRVWREGKQTVTVDEKVAFPVEQIEDADMDQSYHVVKTHGSTGERKVTYEIVVQNGREVSRKEIASLTITQPQKQVEVIGVKGKYTTPSENEAIIWNYLTTHGYSPVQAAGIMGNIQQESGFNTGGDGLAQWTGGRLAALYSQPNPGNVYTQIAYLVNELNTSYSGLNSQIKASGSLTQVVELFQNGYERCGVCMEGNRLQYARNILASF